MKLGARIFKTGISITMAIYICAFFDLEGAIFAAIAAALAIQPSLFRSWQYSIEQIQANIIGAVLAILVTFTIGNQPVIIALTVMLVIALNIQFKLERTIPIAIVTVLAIMESSEIDFFLFAINRFSLILIGVLSSIVVNALFIPPKYEDRLLQKIRNLRESINLLSRIVLDDDTEDRTTREDVVKMTKHLDEIKSLFSLFQEERRYFGKRTFELKRRMVVIRTMIETSSVGLQSLKTISHHHIALTRNQHPLIDQLRQLLEQLAHYQEKIYLKFDGRIRAQHPHVKDEEIVLTTVQLIRSVLEEGIADQDDKLHHLIDLLPVVAMIQEYHEQLDRLDKIVDQYFSYHQ